MIRLLKYLRPFLSMLLLALVLLFVQANADLALPDYMSRIVNVGIQQAGIESPVPVVLRSEKMDRILFFLNPAEKDMVLSHYREVSSDQAGEEYSGLNTEKGLRVYLLKPLSAEERKALEPVMARGMFISAYLGKSRMEMETNGTRPDPPPQGEYLKTIIDSIELPDAQILKQAAISYVSEEYEALGIDVSIIRSRYILKTGLMMLLLTLVSAASTITVGFLSARIAAGFARDLRLDVFQRVESFSLREFDSFSTASLITRSTNDIMQIQMLWVMLIRMVFYAPIIGIGGIIRAIDKNSSMWWIIAAAVGALSILVFIAYKVAVPKFKIIQKYMDRLNLVSREGLSGMMVIRAFNRQAHEEERFDKANRDLADTTLFVNRVMALMMPIMMFIMNGLSVLIIWIGAKEIAASSMQVGDMMAFMQYTMQIVMAFLMLSMTFIMLPRAAVSADRVSEVLASEPTVKDPEKPEPFSEDLSATVEFDHVSFRYASAEEDVLKDLSFTAKPGETTAIIGATGSGKSTLVNLIPRFYDVTEGSVKVGGRDVRRVNQRDLRDRIGHIPQRAVLFSGSIKDNLHYADESASEEELMEAVTIAQAEDFVASGGDGLNSSVSQGGINLSGGQKQRISIARALVKKAPVYIFDDSFSALDFKTDSLLRKALKKRMGNSTVIIVTQRISTIKNAEQILVLDGGRIIGRGRHSYLMENCEAYREIATSQLTEEELT